MRTVYKEGGLDGDWATFAKIAGQAITSRVPLHEQEDLLHDIILEMVKVAREYQASGKPLRKASLMLVAKYKLMRYWDKRKRRLFWLNCKHCTPEQHRECRNKEPGECPKGKARPLLSLNKTVGKGNGNGHKELGDLIPDGYAGDLDARLDARHILQTLPKRLVKIGYKRYAGMPLEDKDECYLIFQRKNCKALRAGSLGSGIAGAGAAADLHLRV